MSRLRAPRFGAQALACVFAMTLSVVVAEIVDADNLREPFVQSTYFKKLPANTPFKPEACDAR